MQYVDDRWYRFYSLVSTSLQILLGITCVTVWLVPSLKVYENSLGVSWLTLIIVVVHVVYVLALYQRYYRVNAFMATILLAGMLSLNTISLMHVTGQFASWYIVLWGLIVLLSGIFGGSSILGVLFLSTAYFILLQEGGFEAGGTISLRDTLTLAGLYLLGVATYYIWKPKYLGKDSLRVKQLSNILNNRQEQSDILLQSISDGVIATNADGKIGMINEPAAILVGWDANEATGLDVRSVVQLQDDKGKSLPDSLYPFSQVMSTKTPQTNTYTVLQRATNTARVVSFVTTPVMVPKTKELAGCVTIMRDVSNQKQEEERRADFISTASHEMRTPVAAIEGYLALALNEKISNIDSKAREYLEKAQSSTRHLGQLFQDLLTSAKAEDGRLTSHPTILELSEFIESLSDDLRFAAQKKNLGMEYIIGKATSANATIHEGNVHPLYYAHVDPDRLREVITNIFDNAVKYTETGKVSIGLTGDQEVVQIRITDTGPGIPAEDVPHLFQKFYRVDNSATRTIGGTGLGLFISRKIIELYHGQIWVESDLGHGSTFFINLPRLDVATAEKMQAAEKEKESLLDVIQ